MAARAGSGMTRLWITSLMCWILVKRIRTMVVPPLIADLIPRTHWETEFLLDADVIPKSRTGRMDNFSYRALSALRLVTSTSAGNSGCKLALGCIGKPFVQLRTALQKPYPGYYCRTTAENLQHVTLYGVHPKCCFWSSES